MLFVLFAKLLRNWGIQFKHVRVMEDAYPIRKRRKHADGARSGIIDFFAAYSESDVVVYCYLRGWAAAIQRMLPFQ